MTKIQLIKSDLYRYTASTSLASAIKAYIKIPGFRLTFWYRLAHGKGLLALICAIILRHYNYKFGIDLSRETKIGPGLYIGHFSGIVITPGATIGKNVNISQNVTIGVTAVKSDNPKRYPIICDNVYIGTGAVILGGIEIGHHAAIGANSVVTHNIEPYSRVVGAPARTINTKGTDNMLMNLWPPTHTTQP